jgi:hypothetical protein
MSAAAALMSIEADDVDYSSIDNSLIATDLLLRQWGSGADNMPTGEGRMHPLERMRLIRAGALIPTGPIPPPREIEICERVVLTSPKAMQAFLKLWYRDTLTPVVVKADRLRISRAKIYTVWSQNVHYIRGRLHGHGVKV